MDSTVSQPINRPMPKVTKGSPPPTELLNKKTLRFSPFFAEKISTPEMFAIFCRRKPPTIHQSSTHITFLHLMNSVHRLTALRLGSWASLICQEAADSIVLGRIPEADGSRMRIWWDGTVMGRREVWSVVHLMHIVYLSTYVYIYVWHVFFWVVRRLSFLWMHHFFETFSELSCLSCGIVFCLRSCPSLYGEKSLSSLLSKREPSKHLQRNERCEGTANSDHPLKLAGWKHQHSWW